MRLPCPWKRRRLVCVEVERMNGHQEDATSWSRRYKANVEKLATGDPARVNEVIDDLERRRRQHGLTAGEERLLQKARDLRQRLNGG
jgi:RNA polymerase-interacting CarD/CdnL/TRCF family regulator